MLIILLERVRFAIRYQQREEGSLWRKVQSYGEGNVLQDGLSEQNTKLYYWRTYSLLWADMGSPSSPFWARYFWGLPKSSLLTTERMTSMR